MPQPREQKRKRGVRHPLTAEQRELAGRYLPLARSIAKPFKSQWPAYRDDFESAAMMALVEAAESFDAGRNVRFATFARLRIIGAIKDIQRSIQRHAAIDAGGTKAGAGRAEELEEIGAVMNTTPDPDVGSELEQADALEAWLCELPEKHAEACRHIYLRGMSQEDAARIMGLSRPRVSSMYRESLAILGGTWDQWCRESEGRRRRRRPRPRRPRAHQNISCCRLEE